MDWAPLLAAARDCRERAYSPYSGFAVGAALRAADGSIHAGCNVENRSFGLTVCAERVALGAAVAAGAGAPLALAVVAEATPPALPCGLCLQTLAEFAGPELPILLANLDGEQSEVKLGELLPHPFELPGRAG